MRRKLAKITEYLKTHPNTVYSQYKEIDSSISRSSFDSLKSRLKLSHIIHPSRINGQTPEVKSIIDYLSANEQGGDYKNFMSHNKGIKVSYWKFNHYQKQFAKHNVKENSAIYHKFSIPSKEMKFEEIKKTIDIIEKTGRLLGAKLDVFHIDYPRKEIVVNQIPNRRLS